MTCLILLRGEISKRLLSHFMVCSVLTFVGDMFDGNMAVLVECHNFHLSLVEQKVDCGQCFIRFSQMMDGTFH